MLSKDQINEMNAGIDVGKILKKHGCVLVDDTLYCYCPHKDPKLILVPIDALWDIYIDYKSKF